MGVSLGIIFGLIAMLGYGFANALTKVPASSVGSEKTIFLRGIVVNLILMAVFLYFISETNFSIVYILIALAISIVGYFALLFFYSALKMGKVGIVTPIGSSSVMFTVLLSIIFFKEVLTNIQITSIIIIIIGVMLISIDFKNIKKSDLFRISSGIPFALLTCLLWGIVYFLIKIPVVVLGPFLTSFIFESGVMASSWFHLKASKMKFKLPEKRILIYILFLGISVATGTLFYNLGVGIANVSIVIALTSSNPFIAALYSRLVYKEKLKLIQYAAIVLIVAGIVLVSLF